jgi:CubicO group peptidase (beta-lactamase class C family)
MPVWRRYLNLAIAAVLVAASLPALGAKAAAQGQSPAAPATSATDLQTRLAVAEKVIEAKRQELGVPGAALVVVKDDKVVLMKGLGVRDFEKKAPVTPDTLFAIGSSSKAFTAMLVAMAADAGKLSLDDSPKKFLPYFKLQDADADARITVRDLLAHSSGLNRTDIAWITGALTREEVIRVAAQAKPTAKLREKFQYQNVMYSAAGEVAARALGSTWEGLIGERIFKPLGMKSSVLTAPAMQRASDYAFGYVYDESTKQTRRMPQRDFPAVAAAGAINSNARDMAQWLRLMLGGGVFEGKRLVSEKNFAELVKPQQKIAGNIHYGLGWFLRDWHGHKVVEHGGNIDGFNALVALMPDQKLGFVLLTNVTASPLGATAMEALWSNVVGPPPTPEGQKAAQEAPSKIENEVGKYLLAEANTTMEVALSEGKLTLAVPGQPVYPLVPQGGRRYQIADAPGFFITFRPAKENAQESEAYLEQPHGNFVLKKIKAADATNAPASGAAADYTGPLKEAVGSYERTEGNGPAIEIVVRDGKLAMQVVGQTARPLEERGKDVLGLAGLPDSYSVNFQRDAAGRITGLLMKQPNGEFPLRRVPELPAGLTAEEVLRRAVEAMGGEANLRRHKTMRIVGDANLEHQGVTGEVLIYAAAPNSLSSHLTLSALGKRLGTYHEFFDGTQGGEGGSFVPFRPKTGRGLADLRITADFYGPLNWRTLFKTAELKRRGRLGDEEVYVVVLTPEQGNPVTQYYSAQTFRLLRQDSTATSDTISEPVTERFSDFREVDGVLIPFTRVASSPSNGDTVMKFREVKFDVDIPADAFRWNEAAHKK